jgi:hypothetical protein
VDPVSAVGIDVADVQRSTDSPRERVPVTSASAHYNPVSGVLNPAGQGMRPSHVQHSGPVRVDPHLNIHVHQDNHNNEPLLASSEALVEIQEHSADKDSNFQEPVQTKKRATCASANLRAWSLKRKSTLRKRVKKGTAIPEVPRISPNNLGRLEARENSNPVAVGKLCWILHPMHPQIAIVYGKTGPTWKTKRQRLASCCVHGEQMVQVHGTFRESVPLMFCELERQPFRVIDEAIVPTSGSGVYVKWDTRYLIRTTDIRQDGTCT